MKDYYEDLWQRLPADLVPPDYAARRAFLLSEARPGQHVLDLGCGAGEFTRELIGAGAVPVGVEVAEAALERARVSAPSAEFRLAEIDAGLPFEDASFDLVWASDVIEHVSDTALWLNEVRRVLKRGGRLLVTTPSHGRLRVALGGIERFSEPLGDHLHLYTRRSLAGVLNEFAFEQVMVRAVGGVPGLRRSLRARAVR